MLPAVIYHFIKNYFMLGLKADRYQLVELVVGANVTGTNTDIYFQNQPQLQSISGGVQVFACGIEVFTVNDIALSPLTGGNPVASAADMRNATLTLSVNTNYQFLKLPLAALHRNNTNTAGESSVQDLFLLNDILQIDWTKSFVSVLGVPAAVPFSYLFGVYYRYSTDVKPVEQAQMFAEILSLRREVDNFKNSYR